MLLLSINEFQSHSTGGYNVLEKNQPTGICTAIYEPTQTSHKQPLIVYNCNKKCRMQQVYVTYELWLLID